MVVFALAFIVTVLLAMGVVALVAVQARRDGREVLTPHGEQLLHTARGRTSDLASAARERAAGPRADAPGHEVGDISA